KGPHTTITGRLFRTFALAHSGGSFLQCTVVLCIAVGICPRVHRGHALQRRLKKRRV
ncbi:unnamed protein product, partial [Ectocarpus sp. 12 AP-2014]